MRPEKTRHSEAVRTNKWNTWFNGDLNGLNSTYFPLLPPHQTFLKAVPPHYVVSLWYERDVNPASPFFSLKLGLLATSSAECVILWVWYKASLKITACCLRGSFHLFFASTPAEKINPLCRQVSSPPERCWGLEGRLHMSKMQDRAKELITLTTVGTASQSGTFLLSWIHFQVKGSGRSAPRSPHSLCLERIMEQHMCSCTTQCRVHRH